MKRVKKEIVLRNTTAGLKAETFIVGRSIGEIDVAEKFDTMNDAIKWFRLMFNCKVSSI